MGGRRSVSNSGGKGTEQIEGGEKPDCWLYLCLQQTAELVWKWPEPRQWFVTGLYHHWRTVTQEEFSTVLFLFPDIIIKMTMSWSKEGVQLED